MTIEVKKNAEETIIEVVGRLDTVSVPALDKVIKEETQDIKHLVLEMKGLEYISSAGLRVLLSTQKKMQQVGTLTVKNVSEEVMEVLEMTGFTQILTIE